MHNEAEFKGMLESSWKSQWKMYVIERVCVFPSES